jgi:hypothetical protein
MDGISPELEDFQRVEANQVLNAAIEMALKLLATHEDFIPFGIAVSISGEHQNVVADDTLTSDRKVLSDTVRNALREGCDKFKYRTIALAQCVVVKGTPDSNAIQVTVDQGIGQNVTCYLPFSRKNGELVPGELYATEPIERFYRR